MTDDVTDSAETPPSRRGQHVRANRDRSFDAALGARIRALRVAASMSQTALGQAAGISFQQVQKYELGKDRISASTLLAFAAVLNVSPGSLYEDSSPPPVRSGSDAGVSVKAAVLFQQIEDSRVQKRLVELAKALGEP